MSAKFKKKKIYTKSYHPMLSLIKCENSDGSESYRLATKDGQLINDTNYYPTNFEDIINVHPDHQDKLNSIISTNEQRSVMGHNLDKEIISVQKSFLTLLEELFVDI